MEQIVIRTSATET